MARSSKKNPQDLNDLPAGWSTREELALLICQDPDAVAAWNRHVRLGAKQRYSEDDPVKGWTSNLFVQNSWQLTMFGSALLGSTYKHWIIRNDANARLTGRVIVNMNRLINGPWHAHNTSIRVWDQYLNFELAMFDGNLHQFVDFRSPR
jgi:hypothetical protein